MSFIKQSSELLPGFKRQYEKQERMNREQRRNVTCSTWSPFGKTGRPVSHGHTQENVKGKGKAGKGRGEKGMSGGREREGSRRGQLHPTKKTSTERIAAE